MLGLEQNTLADGLFHAATWICLLIGVLLGAPGVGSGRAGPSMRFLLGTLLAGWGLFNLVEGLIDHHLLGVHDVRDDVADPRWWNLGFLAFGAVLVLVGAALARRGSRQGDDELERADLARRGFRGGRGLPRPAG